MSGTRNLPLGAWVVQGLMAGGIPYQAEGVPTLELDYPGNEEEGIIFVRKVKEFLTRPGGLS